VAAGAGIAVTGVVGVAAGWEAAALPEAEVLVARDLGVAMAVMGYALEGVAWKRDGPGAVGKAPGGTGGFLSRRATSGR